MATFSQPISLLAYSQTTKRRMRGCFKKQRRGKHHAYDPWSKRRFAHGGLDNTDSLVSLTTDRGYTEHEHLDEVGVIHMNGRIFDPYIGRFMSADPFIQAPFELQSHNRYAYVMNNPLAFTDPSGYFSLGGLIKTAIVIYVAYQTGQWASATTGLGWGAVGSGALGGAAGGFTGAALGGGNLEQALRGAAIGGATGAAFGWAGTTGPAGVEASSAIAANSFERYAAHALVGCASSVAGGGKCESGVAAAVFGKFATNQINPTPGHWDTAQFVATVVAGGVGSVIGGGKFENGAMTAAYGYIFNALSERGKQDRASRIKQNDALRRFASNADMKPGESIIDLDPARLDAAAKLDQTGKALMVVGVGVAIVYPATSPMALTFFNIGAGASLTADILNPIPYKGVTDSLVDRAMTRIFQPIYLGTRAAGEVAKEIKNRVLQAV